MAKSIGVLVVVNISFQKEGLFSEMMLFFASRAPNGLDFSEGLTIELMNINNLCSSIATSNVSGVKFTRLAGNYLNS